MVAAAGYDVVASWGSVSLRVVSWPTGEIPEYK